MMDVDKYNHNHGGHGYFSSGDGGGGGSSSGGSSHSGGSTGRSPHPDHVRAALQGATRSNPLPVGEVMNRLHEAHPGEFGVMDARHAFSAMVASGEIKQTHDASGHGFAYYLPRSPKKEAEHMNVVTKSVDATVEPVESEYPNGEFIAVLTNEALDRDDENLWADEWKQPLPAKIHIDGDHGRSLDKTVGSAVPTLDGNRMIGKGTYAGTPYAQMVRQLVNEGHINSLSVTYAEHKNQKDGGIQRELLNAAFVAIPANPEAIVLSSKAATMDKADGGMGASGNNPDVKHDDMVQAIHDAATHLGAQCMNEVEADPGTADGANKSLGEATFSNIADKSSSPDGAGLPQESAEESAAAEPAAKAAGPAAADESADDIAVKVRLRALKYLTEKSNEHA